MLKKLGFFSILLIFFSTIILASAQEHYEFESGYDLEVPAGWEVEEVEDRIISISKSSSSAVVLVPDPSLVEDMRFDASELPELVEHIYDNLFSDAGQFSSKFLEEDTIDGRDVVYYEFFHEDENLTVLLIAFAFSDEAAGYVVGLSNGDDFDDRDEVFDIVASFDVVDTDDDFSLTLGGNSDLTFHTLYPIAEIDEEEADEAFGPVVGIPDGWELSIEGEAVSVSNDLGSNVELSFEVGFSFLIENPDDSDQSMQLFDPLLMAQAFDINQPPTNTSNAFVELGEALDISIDEDDLEALEIDGRDALALDNFIMLEMSSGEVALAVINEDWELDDTAMDILASFDSESASCAVGSAQNVNVRQSNSTSTGVVTTLDAQSLSLVSGQATGNDGFVWWRLANGGWVRSDVVSEFYNCDGVAVVQAAAVESQPAQPQTSSGSDSGSDSGTAPTAVPQQQQPSGGATVQSGSWTMYLAPTTLASCAGTNTVEFSTQEVFGRTSLPITVTAGSGQIFLGNSVLNSTGGNSYAGSLTFESGRNWQLSVTVVSSTELSGSIVQNFESQGTPCSATTPFTATKN